MEGNQFIDEGASAGIYQRSDEMQMLQTVNRLKSLYAKRRAFRYWVGMALAVTADVVMACKCVETSVAERYESAGAVFVGKVVDVATVPGKAGVYYRMSPDSAVWIEESEIEPEKREGLEHREFVKDEFRVRFKVLEGVKNSDASEAVARIPNSSCAPRMAVGEAYLVYAGEDGETDQCKGTRVIGPSTDGNELAALRRLRQDNGNENPASDR